MHTILHKLPDGGVGSYPPNPKVLDIITGSGFGWSDAQAAWEAKKFTDPGPPESGWPGFNLTFATEWIEALARGGLTEAQALNLFKRRTQLRRGYTVSAIINDSQLPVHIRGDRYFRDAVVWDEVVPNKCGLDMAKARIIHMSRIRLVRDVELAALDVPFMRAVETGDAVEQQRVAALKTVLRDLPQTFDLSVYTTPETLKAAWPTELPPRVEP